MLAGRHVKFSLDICNFIFCSTVVFVSGHVFGVRESILNSISSPPPLPVSVHMGLANQANPQNHAVLVVHDSGAICSNPN